MATDNTNATIQITLHVNKTAYDLELDPRTTLLDALREHVGLKGTKKGCDRGECGACTIHINGRRANACCTLAIMQQQSEITTIEGVSEGSQLHPVQQAFIQHDAFQCGYCTPGQIMSAIACINEKHTATDAEIKEWMSGNICRCGAYVHILEAVKHAAEARYETL